MEENNNLYWIEGENGVGKSALFLEAPTWLFFDKTIRNLNSTKVVNINNDKNCLVQLKGKKDGVSFIAKRFRNHKEYGTGAELLIKGEKVSLRKSSEINKQLIEFLGVDFEEFISSLIFTSKSLKFSEMTDGVRKAAFEKLLDLQKWSKSKAILDGRIRKFKNSIFSIDKRIEYKNKLLLEKDNSLKINIEKNKEIEEKISSMVKDKNLEIAKIERELENLKSEDELEQVIFSLIDKKDSELKNINNRLLELEKEALLTENKINNNQLKINEAKNLLNSLEGKEFCPLCRQNLKSGTILTLKNYELDVKGFSRNNDTLISTKKLIMEKISELRQSKPSVSLSYENKVEVIKKVLNKVRNLNRELIRLNSEKENIANKDNSLLLVINTLKEEIKGFKKEINNDLWLKNLRQQVLDRYLKFWEVGLSNKGIKNFIIESILPYMNYRAEYYSDLITNGEIFVKFGSQRTLADGRKTEELDFSAVVSSGGDNYKALSEGERRRVDTIVQLVIDDIRRVNNNFKVNLRFYDEFLDPLDEKGIENILKTLKIINGEKVIYLISHNKDLSNKINNKISLFKEKGKTVLLESN